MLHSVLFNKSDWNFKNSLFWLIEHDIIPLKMHVSDNHIRYRITEPKRGENYYTVTLNDSVHLVHTR